MQGSVSELKKNNLLYLHPDKHHSGLRDYFQGLSLSLSQGLSMRANDNNGQECSPRSLRMAVGGQTGDRDLDDISPSFFLRRRPIKCLIFKCVGWRYGVH